MSFPGIGGAGQSFGGHVLYLSKRHDNYTNKGDFAGHFLFRCMQIAGVERWEDIVGKTIRVKSSHAKVDEIGHIIKDDWFNPDKDFEEMKNNN